MNLPLSVRPPEHDTGGVEEDLKGKKRKVKEREIQQQKKKTGKRKVDLIEKHGAGGVLPPVRGAEVFWASNRDGNRSSFCCCSAPVLVYSCVRTIYLKITRYRTCVK